MILEKDISVELIKDSSTRFEVYGINYELGRHSLKGVPTKEPTRYILHYNLLSSDNKGELRIQVNSSGYFVINKPLKSINEKDLYECIELSTKELSKFVIKKKIIPSNYLIQPIGFDDIKPDLTELLKKGITE